MVFNEGYLRVLQSPIESSKELLTIIIEVICKDASFDNLRKRICLIELSANPNKTREYDNEELLAA